ncbi:hypothetical protein [Aeromonas sp. HMWF016]|uniref:hypothetical protein n=1 Tax=Aeromonas sp. HMWF016 TaxID=2056852 RepID=UPI0011B1D55C|nr:hypothetical protein [Aeromonas sp. HMWF016]
MSTREPEEKQIFRPFAQNLAFAVYFQHNQSLAHNHCCHSSTCGLGLYGNRAANMSATCKGAKSHCGGKRGAKKVVASIKFGDLAGNESNDAGLWYSLILPIEIVALLE